jgi:pimeloyl-ACP methyl ester carboxylesterase
MHGTPGSRDGPKPRDSVLYRMGIRLISYDRPGYGGSSRYAGRTVVDAVDDVLAIADRLGLNQFAVVGRSGGAPHALACAARIADRLSRTAALVSVAPPNAPDLDWFDGMNRQNVRGYAGDDVERLLERLRVRAERVRADPEHLLQELSSDMTESDMRVVRDVSIRRLLQQSYAEGLRHGPFGWIDDALALRRPWGFDPMEITGKVKLWHGADDTFSPVHHTHWLADRIPNVEVEVRTSTAHFGAVDVLQHILAWLAPSDQVYQAPRPRDGDGDRPGADLRS